MTFSTFALPLSLTLAVAAHEPRFHGLKSSHSWLPREPLVLTATGEEMIGDRTLPKNFDWRNVNGRNFATTDVNQHIPQYCGGCWIHGTVAHLNDRIKIMRNAAFPDIMVSRQALMNCVPPPPNMSEAGCFGGDPWMIYNYMKDNKVPDESCSPYKALNDKCMPWTVCGNCKPPEGFGAAIEAGKDISKMNFDMTSGCYAVPHFTGYKVSQFGHAKGPDAMMKEIYARGPITCMLNADDEFMFNYSENVERNEGVFVTDAKYDTTDHVVEVAGWGETPSGLKYWVVRNSWGTYWGQAGWFKVRRGVNQALIEGHCTWAVPEFSDENLVDAGLILGDYISGTHMVSLGNEMTTGSLAELAQQPQFSRSSVYVAMLAVAATSALCTSLVLVKFMQPSLPRQPTLLG